jgi:hypothetical protein
MASSSYYKWALVSITLAILVAIAVVIAIIFRGNIIVEQFDEVRSVIGGEKCKSIQKVGMGAATTAVANANGNRIKKWKPKFAPPIDDDAEYCYLNDDISKDEKDFSLSGIDCNKASPFFRDAAFISDVFENNAYGATNNDTINKCVIKIDKSKVTLPELDKFWGNFDENKCVELNASMFERNDMLQGEILTQGRIIDKLQQAKNAYNDKIAQADNNANLLTNDVETNTTYLHSLENAGDAIDRELLDVNNTLTSRRVFCSTSTSQLENNATSCEKKLATLKDDYDYLLGQANVERNELDKYNNIIVTKNNDIEKIKASRNANDLINSRIVSSLLSVQEYVDTCEPNLSATNRAIAVCKNDTSDRNAEFAAVDKQRSDCNDALKTCKTALDACNAQALALTSDINKYTSLNASCGESLKACLAQLDILRIEIKIATTNYEYIMVALPDLSCESQNKQLRDLKDRTDELKGTCATIVSDTIALKATVKQLEATMASDLQTCKNDVKQRLDAYNAIIIPRHMVSDGPGGKFNANDADAICNKFKSGAKSTGEYYNASATIDACGCEYSGIATDVPIAQSDNAKFDAMRHAFQNSVPTGQYTDYCPFTQVSDNVMASLCELKGPFANWKDPMYKSFDLDLNNCGSRNVIYDIQNGALVCNNI